MAEQTVQTSSVLASSFVEEQADLLCQSVDLLPRFRNQQVEPNELRTNQASLHLGLLHRMAHQEIWLSQKEPGSAAGLAKRVDKRHRSPAPTCDHLQDPPTYLRRQYQLHIPSKRVETATSVVPILSEIP